MKKSLEANSGNLAKKLCKAARACYQKFASDLPSLGDMARFCRMVKQQTRDDIGVMARPDGEFTTSAKEALGIVMDNSFPDSEDVPAHIDNVTRLLNDTSGEFTYPEYEWISLDLIRDSFAHFKNS